MICEQVSTACLCLYMAYWVSKYMYFLWYLSTAKATPSQLVVSHPPLICARMHACISGIQSAPAPEQDC